MKELINIPLINHISDAINVIVSEDGFPITLAHAECDRLR